MIDCTLLMELQKFDLQIDEQETRVQTVKERVHKLEADVKKEEELLKNKEALQKKITLRQKKAEGDMESLNDKVRTADIRMKSAGLGPDTYVALEKEVTLAKQQISTLEGKILEDMDKIEFLKKDIEKAAKVLTGRKQLLEDSRKKLQTDIAAIAQYKDTLLTQRRQASLKIPADLLEPYEELRAKFKSRVIWEAETPFCPACGMSFPPSFLTPIHGTPNAEHCPNCSMLIKWTGMADGTHVN